MRASTFLISAALTLCATTSFAQSSYNRVIQPQSQTVDSIINAPIEYDDNGVVKAQHFNADSLTDAEYQEILDEAARIRSYRDANNMNFESDYVTVDTPTYLPPTSVSSSITQAPSYQIELFAPESSYTTASSASSFTSHIVAKGDTLYNISKRFGTTVPALQAENGMSGTALSIGQSIRIPGVMTQASNLANLPVYAGSTSHQGYIKSYVIEPTPELSRSQLNSSFSSERNYAVAPKDTLYKISRFTCVDVKDIIARNGLTNPDALSPGDMLILPAGHCLAN
jgi:LysM repeat protein